MKKEGREKKEERESEDRKKTGRRKIREGRKDRREKGKRGEKRKRRQEDLLTVMNCQKEVQPRSWKGETCELPLYRKIRAEVCGVGNVRDSESKFVSLLSGGTVQKMEAYCTYCEMNRKVAQC